MPPANPPRGARADEQGTARHWLFVCTGNLCRSPMAAGLALEVAHEHGLVVEVRSRGTGAVVGAPAEPRAVAVCAEVGVDLSAHRAEALTADDVRWADVIFAMEEGHAVAVRAVAPNLGERLVQLGPYAGLSQIDDPYGSWFVARYRRTRDELLGALRRWAAEVTLGAPRGPR